MLQISLAVLAVLAVIYVVPLLLYGISSRYISMPAPEDAGPVRFLSGILITKLGTAVAFVVLFWLARDVFAQNSLAYAAPWFVMFAASEAGDAISGRSSVAESVIGVVAEAIYVPLATLIVLAML